MGGDDAESLFAAYLHPPMLPPEEGQGLGLLGSPKSGEGGKGGGVHPPMLPQEWGGYEFHESAMAGY